MEVFIDSVYKFPPKSKSMFDQNDPKKAIFPDFESLGVAGKKCTHKLKTWHQGFSNVMF